MPHDPQSIALAYIAACANKDFGAVARLLAPDLRFVGPGNAVTGADPYLAILRRISPIWLRSDVKQTFNAGSEVCVIYDLVTDTPAGAVPVVEWLRIQHDKIATVTLFFDRLTFKPAGDELARRAAG